MADASAIWQPEQGRETHQCQVFTFTSHNQQEKHTSVMFSHSPHTINKEEKHTSVTFSHSPHTINKEEKHTSVTFISHNQQGRETHQRQAFTFTSHNRLIYFPHHTYC